MWFTIPDVEHYKKYKDDAYKNFDKNIFRAFNILTYAKSAQLLDEAVNELNNFCNALENDEDLQLFLYLIYYVAYKSGEKFVSYEYHEKLPKSKEVEEKYPGMSELVIALLASNYFYDYLEKKGLSEYVKKETYFQKIKKWSEENKIKNGTYGLVDWGYFRHQYATGQILAIGRLVFEKAYYHSFMEVYKKGNEYIKIATDVPKYNDFGYMIPNKEDGRHAFYEKSGNILRCQTFDDDGVLLDKIIELNLDEYELFLDRNTQVLNIHIPDGNLAGPLLPELVDKSLEMARIVIKKEGEWQPKAFNCTTWMISPAVKKAIKPTSNIYKFTDRFDCITTYQNEYSLFGHIFGVPKCPIEQLEPKNDFQQRILNLVKGGSPLRNGHGYIKEEF